MNIIKKWWFWLLVILAIILVWFLIGFFKCGSKSNPFTSVIGECRYECPSGWISCMPALSFSEAKYCSWVGQNCPNAQIAV
ncbi:MAG TPA: hypothetical protein P5277_03630 [Candidatus Paceibacterota bacterium]|nr:hypothetical protein [Candidatus Paceibacterota bacterium]